MDISQSPISMFDHVRIHNTSLTREKKVAGLIGVVYGVTTPSNPENRKLVGGEIIGELTEDRAYGVHFEKMDETLWFASHLVDFVDYNPGAEVNIGGLKAVRLETGEWQELTEPKRRFQNYSEMVLVIQDWQETSTLRTGNSFWGWLKKNFFSN